MHKLLLPILCWMIIGSTHPAVAATSGLTVVYQLDGQLYEGYWLPATTDAPLVILVHDWDGLTAYEQQRAAMLNKLGYSVFAVDMFGQGIRPTLLEDKKRFTGALYQNRPLMTQLLQAGIDSASRNGGNPGNMVLLGYCFGGSVVLEGARQGMPVRGSVGFHAGLATPPGEDYRKTSGSVLILHGSADTAVPMSDFASAVNDLEKAGVAHEAIVYSGAPHAFSVFGGPNYREDADHKSWTRFVDYLQETTRL